MQILDYPIEYLNLEFTLTCGQAFRWTLDSDGFWAAPVHGKVIRIREEDSHFLWETLPGEPDYELLSHYFRLNVDIRNIYTRLSEADARLAQLVERFRGLRLLRQEPTECLLSYICSTANSVPRISAAIEDFSSRHGEFIAEVGGRRHYSFPTVNNFAAARPNDLANPSYLGWRGESIRSVAQQLLDRSPGWLDSLTERDHGAAKRELMTLRGVGAKIADCVALFALGKDEAVPVDTHVRQVAQRLYMPEIKTKSITSRVYNEITLVFQEKFGDLAGWAQQFLFYENWLSKQTKKSV